MIVLGIETTCDETAAAVVVGGKKILSNVISSQSKLHEQYGGVYPEMAARHHVDLIIPVIKQALSEAQVKPHELDLIAVAHTPGLIGPLLVGLNTAKALSMAWSIPYVGVNHVEAHLYAAMMGNEKPLFPSIGLVVSGGHTFLAKMEGIGQYEMIGQTVDDAIGEAFDKVAALLDLPYPGGPHVEKLALSGDPTKYPLKAGIVKGSPWDFSFSGLKTNVLYTVKGQNGDKKGKSVILESDKASVAASFQEAALGCIAKKAKDAMDVFECRALYVGGGVSQNKRLRTLLSGANVYWPSPSLCLDNGAMIAGLGPHVFNGTSAPLSLEPLVRSPFLRVQP